MFKEIGTALFVVGSSGIVDRIVEPQRHFHDIRAVHQQTGCIKLRQAVSHVLVVMVVTMSLGEVPEQTGPDIARVPPSSDMRHWFQSAQKRDFWRGPGLIFSRLFTGSPTA